MRNIKDCYKKVKTYEKNSFAVFSSDIFLALEDNFLHFSRDNPEKVLISTVSRSSMNDSILEHVVIFERKKIKKQLTDRI